MKKILLIFTTLLGFVLSYGQNDFPYSKLLNYSATDFQKAKFVYFQKKNHWVLSKNHALQATANVLSALNGAEADIKPDPRDYEITVQMGEGGAIAYIQVVFFQNSTYHDILTFMADKGENNLETKSGNVTKHQFNYGDYSFSVVNILNEIKTTSTNTFAAAKTTDNSYNKYIYTIYTGVNAESDYLDKQAAKQQKRDDKGKKQNNVDNFY